MAIGGLDGQPGAEFLAAGWTEAAWCDALWPGAAWDEEADRPRIAEAFRRLTATARRWPAPAHLRELLPARAEAPALERPRGAMSETVRELVAGVAQKLGVRRG